MIQLSKDQLETVKKIIHLYFPRTEIWVFGSRIKGTAKKYSDLDLAIVSKEKVDIKKLLLAIDAFEESELPFKVDLLDIHRIDESFKKIIEDKHEVLCKG